MSDYMKRKITSINTMAKHLGFELFKSLAKRYGAEGVNVESICGSLSNIYVDYDKDKTALEKFIDDFNDGKFDIAYEASKKGVYIC